jgi:hypothetical protein
VRILHRVVLSPALAIALLALSLPAQAQGSLTRTFVSSTGNDTNPCTTAAPCATFARAYSQVQTSGIVAALDPGKYGPLTITGSVTIDGNGWAAITVPSGGGIGIDVEANAIDEVILTGLTIDGVGSGIAGIAYGSGASLTIEKCSVRNLGTSGLQFYAFGSTPQTLVVSNSSFVGPGTGITIGAQGPNAATVSIDRTEFDNTGTALSLSDGGQNSTGVLNVAVTNSIFANNLGNGVFLETVSDQSSVNATLTRSQVSGSGIGIMTEGTHATLWVGQTNIIGNAVGFDILTGGVINSYGDNYFADNKHNGQNGSLTPASKQ